MLGLMQDWPLLIHKVIDHAASQFGNQEIVSRLVEGPIHRETYQTLRQRWDQARRSDCDTGLEHASPSGIMVWDHRIGGYLSHRESASV